MPDLIENPVINSPYAEPKRHFAFDTNGITNQIADGRRESSFFIPIAPARRKEAQLSMDALMTADRMRPNELINRIRSEVDLWRRGGYRGITPVTRQLLTHWTDESRELRLFFCQVEAVETAIFIGEAARRQGVVWIENELKRMNADYNGALYRQAVKIATGGGKTTVMAMLIAWQALNKAANRQDIQFSDRFLVVTPGITVRDRLRVLKPSDPDNLYSRMDLVPDRHASILQTATVELTNYHAFLRREKVAAARLTKQILADGKPTDAFTETANEMVNRVCRAFGNRRSGIVVINDEAHHCYYRRREPEVVEKFTSDERKEVEQETKAAEAWISGLEAIRTKLGIKAVYDLSATPFFLKGRAISRAPCSRGWCRTSHSSTPLSPASSRCRAFRWPTIEPPATLPSAICGSTSAISCRRAPGRPPTVRSNLACPATWNRHSTCSMRTTSARTRPG